MKALWECAGCGHRVRSDPLAMDDWGGTEVGIGPDCDECGDANMDVVDEAAESKEGEDANPNP